MLASRMARHGIAFLFLVVFGCGSALLFKCGGDGEQYDDDTETCCGGRVYPKTTNWKCCGGTWMSTEKFICFLYMTPSRRTSRCGKSFVLPHYYNPISQVCCGSKIYRKSPTLDCCDGSIVYNPQTSTCETDKHRVVKKQ
ncbi:hypothetical protein LSAT2_025004 [Lamellibrachia satsuma]|nr:hypothetical protein LSAT2_025004 [Lamellibrachia satsuma]